MATKRSRKKKGLLGNLNLDIPRIGAVAAGAAGAKMLNVPLNKLVDKYAGSGGGQVTKMIVPGIKLAGAVVMMGQKNQMVQDAGLGVAAIAVVELIDKLIPSANLGAIGYTDEMERVGTVIEIDLDELAPGTLNGYSGGSLEEMHDVAGMDANVLEQMELAGVTW